MLHNESHELGNGWGFYIDTDIDVHNNVEIHYNNNYQHQRQYNIIRQHADTNKNYINDINVKTIENKDDFINMDVVSIISITFTCFFAFLMG